MSLKFGDSEWTEADLHPLTIEPETVIVSEDAISSFTTLSYRMGGASPTLAGYGPLIGVDEGASSDPCKISGPFSTVFCRIARNSSFELNIFGQDIESEEFLHYRYTTSAQNGYQVPEPSTLAMLVLACGVLLSCRFRS